MRRGLCTGVVIALVLLVATLIPTPQAKTRRQSVDQDRNLRGFDGPEDRSLSERCITYGSPRIQAAYNSYYQIFQTRDTVVILMEMIHDARVIPLDRRPHVGD